jgi:hypothetical protein
LLRAVVEAVVAMELVVAGLAVTVNLLANP